MLICDDDIDFINMLKEKIEIVCKNQGIEYQLNHYLSPIEIVKENGIDDVNIIFLDIDMPDMNGFEFAQRLKEDNIYIIFVTNRDELVFQSMKYHPFYFIRKNHMNNEVESQIVEINKIIQNSRNQHFFVETPNGSQKIEMDTILYIENIKNYVNIYLTDLKMITIRKSMKVMERDLSSYGFIRVQAGYIINMRYVENINKKEITLLHNKVIPISRGKFNVVKEKIMGGLLND